MTALPRPARGRARSRIARILLVSALGALAVATEAPVRIAAADPARQLPARFTRSPYSLMSLSVGAPNDGWQVRSRQLRARPSLRVKRPTGELSFGHPALVFMLERSADDLARQFPEAVLTVGDLSAEFGGPLDGHRSHQSGRDADVGFFVRDARSRPFRPERFVAFDASGRAKTQRGLTFDDERNYALVTSWLHDSRARITNVFVSRPLRQRLLDWGRAHGDLATVDRLATLLSQPSGVSEHDDHFHVRISCPERQQGICAEASR